MSELSDLYQELILDHSKSPHNYHAMEHADRQAEGYNPLCGDQVTVFVKLNQDRIEDISFQGKGCAISKAAASVMTDTVKNKSTAEAETLFENFQKLVTGKNSLTDEELGKLAVFSGVKEFPTRIKCAILAWHTLRSALENKKEKVKTE